MGNLRNYFVAPGAANFIALERGKNGNSTLVVHWEKPKGGDAIDQYEICYRINANDKNSENCETKVKHTPEMNSYNEELKLIPGQNYSVSIEVQNSAGTNLTDSKTRQTCKYCFRMLVLFVCDLHDISLTGSLDRRHPCRSRDVFTLCIMT